ncbi:MAG: PfkB family carbohydrate kinase [Thermoanaerobaculia bacterium]|nr:PfkB family carbohydrate kinase [Thermoanaerobaculia bacterium]
MSHNTLIDYLCIGHLCHDRYEGGHLLGGSASYISLVARQLGRQPAVLTSTGPDFEFLPVFEQNGIPVCNKPAAETTVFENIYHNGIRTQFLHARAETIYPEDVPSAWRTVPLVHCCPIAGEVDFTLLRAFPGTLTGATIQGWLRQWDAGGRVSPKAMDWSQLAGANVVIFSDADIAGFETALPEIGAAVEVLVMTRGAGGAVVFQGGRQYYFPAFPVKEVDATGAGDVFAAAFLIRFAETRDIARAAAFAHCAASFIVEGVGVNNLPGPDLLQERLGVYEARFGVGIAHTTRKWCTRPLKSRK